MSPGDADVAKFFTRGVKFPRLIGTTTDGTRIPGGPYTMLQAAGGLIAFLTAQATKPLWSNGSLVNDLLVLGAVTAGVVYGLRFVRVGGRNPASALMGVLAVMTQPKHGRLGGRRIRIRKPHRIHGHGTTVPLPTRAAGARTQPVAPAVGPEPAATPLQNALVPGIQLSAGRPTAPGTRPPLHELIFAATTRPGGAGPDMAELGATGSPGPQPSRQSATATPRPSSAAATDGTAVARLLARAGAQQSGS